MEIAVWASHLPKSASVVNGAAQFHCELLASFAAKLSSRDVT